MAGLSDEGKRIVSDMAQRHGFSEDAVLHMLFALQNGGIRRFGYHHFAARGKAAKGR